MGILLKKILEKIDDPFVSIQCALKWFEKNVENLAQFTVESEENEALVEVVKAIDLKSLNPSQLSKIQPCSLITMEQLYVAFVHHGSNSKVETALPSHPHGTNIHVYGAGVDCLNGCYPQRSFGPVFFRKGNYGDLECEFIVSLKSCGTWSIEVVISKEVDGKSRTMLMYQSPESKEMCTDEGG